MGAYADLRARLNGPIIDATQRLIAGSFRRDGERLAEDKRPRFHIPTRPDMSDDCVVIDALREAATAIETLERERDEARRDRDALRKWWDENPSLIHHRAEAAEARVAKLKEALSQLLRCEYDGPGLRDCTDNSGAPYQSADLAKRIAEAEELVGAREALKDTSP